MYTAIEVDARGNSLGIHDFETLEQLEQANEKMLDESNGCRFLDWGKSIKQCEMCDHLYDPQVFEVLGGRTSKSGFCSDDCKQEADDEIRMWDAAHQRNVEMYGDDVASYDN